MLTHSKNEREADRAKVLLVELDHGMLDDVHCVMTPQTHLNFLADVIDVGSIESVGDLLIDLGSWSWPYAPFVWGTALLVKNRKKKYEY